jgi:hypothetical protein
MGTGPVCDPGTTGSSQGVVSSLTEKAKDVASSVADKAQEMTSSVTHRVGEAASSVGQRAQDAASTVADTWDSGRRYVQEEGVSGMLDDLTVVIRRNPIPSLLIGFSLGFLTARLMKR